jgi:alpha-D-ribose 1-methylphosphonate 5-triphosphate synthase subunit PhnL
MPADAIVCEGLCKDFTLHLQEAWLRALEGVSLRATFGSCLAVNGPSGCGKSTLLRCLYGNYRVGEGRLLMAHRGSFLDLGEATEREILELRRHTVSYVSQFLRVIPRVPALEIVAAPLVAQGVPKGQAAERAMEALERLSIPERLWRLPPLTFSGGEKQRVNIARGLIRQSPILLLDEPTASLDRRNRAAVTDLIIKAKEAGSAVVGVFHDREVRERVADHVLELSPPKGPPRRPKEAPGPAAGAEAKFPPGPGPGAEAFGQGQGRARARTQAQAQGQARAQARAKAPQQS